jgi:hypothetical protein
MNLVEIVEKRDDVEVDEFILDLPAERSVESMVAACDSLAGVEVQWVRNYPRGGGIELDVDLHRRMAAAGARAGETLVTAAPLVFRAQWSVLLQVSTVPRLTFGTPGAPHLDRDSQRRFRPFDTIHRVALEPGWLPGWDAHHALLASIWEQQVVIIGRRGEPAFFRSELARLAHLVGGSDGTDDWGGPEFIVDPQEAHRTPVAAPLYTRQGGEGTG